MDSACPCWLMKTLNCPIMTVSHNERAASLLFNSSSLPVPRQRRDVPIVADEERLQGSLRGLPQDQGAGIGLRVIHPREIRTNLATSSKINIARWRNFSQVYSPNWP